MLWYKFSLDNFWRDLSCMTIKHKAALENGLDGFKGFRVGSKGGLQCTDLSWELISEVLEKPLGSQVAAGILDDDAEVSSLFF